MGRNLTDLLHKTLKSSRLELLHLLAYQASVLRIPLYLVGGVVRDILLERPVKDFDLVLEGKSAEFAEYIVRRFGGQIHVHAKFGTATWIPNESTYHRLSAPLVEDTATPLSFDLISARSEIYTHPGALPTVTPSTVDDDLHRRDFTINAMAIRLDGEHFGELLDPLGGERDLRAKLIRVLHAQSFVDDPTRIFRAVRYAGRYGFEIAPETLSRVDRDARLVLRGLSGERLRHEFDLIFDEPEPVKLLTALVGLDVLSDVHSDLANAEVNALTDLVDQPKPEFGDFAIPEILTFRQSLGWTLYLLNLPESAVDLIGKRLAFPMLLARAARGAAILKRKLPSVSDWKPSEWTTYLDEVPALSVYAVWLMAFEPALKEYLTDWRQVKPYTTGFTLQQRGLEPGPKFKELLTRLRNAWLDGLLKSEAEEADFLRSLLAKD